jgi:AcrR family transcriptional regulator
LSSGASAGAFHVTRRGRSIGENRERRQARRQPRGVRRVEDILRAAGALFAELGYDNVTTMMIAGRSGISPGSLYQFFPNKKAIAQAFAADATQHLHQVYDSMQSSEVMSLPLQAFFDAFVDRIMAFNRAYPGYLALQLGTTVSPPLARVLGDLQQGVQARLDGLMAAYWPRSTSAQRRLPLLVSYRVFLALLPLALQGDEESRSAIMHEMKVLLYRYWEPITGG